MLYVHGVGRHEPKPSLKLEWDLALFGRDLGERSRMAYWCDLVHATDSGKGRGRRAAARATEDAGPEGWLADVVLKPAQRSAAEAYRQGLLAELGVEALPTGPGAKVLPLPAWLRRPISRAFLHAFVRDSAAYFFDERLRRAIRQRFIDELAAIPAGQPVTVVAHSQGSVIAYEVLSTLAADALLLDAFVTLGSPLGLQEVQDHLEPPPSIPPVVLRWQNFADPLDPVAADKSLANDFGSAGLRIHDELMSNTQSRQLIGFNPHAAVGYLAHPSVRRAVHDAMRLDFMGRFVLARDVAERLAAPPEERHPVLIEVLEPGFPALGETQDETRAAETQERLALAGGPGGADGDGAGAGAGAGEGEGGRALQLQDRIAAAARALEGLVSDREAACIDPLRRFVAARLTADELKAVGARHRDLRIYAVWQSARKSKLTSRSVRVIKSDAALASFSADGRGITWAVLDTGIQGDHPHFDGIVAAVWDCTRPGPPRRVDPAKAQDRDGHGTHVAGIIAGRAPAASGAQPARAERGVAPAARLVVYKVLDDRGQGEDAWIIKALDHIAQQNENTAGGLAIHGLNLSLGGPFDATVYGCGFSPICTELRRLWRAGTLVVVACGNEGLLQVETPDGGVQINSAMSIGDPANLDDCIAVGSVNADRPNLYGISSFSSRGPTADGRGKPDVVAPGERISSANARFRGGEDLYRMDSGTSMAAPHVSGLLAAFLSVRGEFRGRPDETKAVLLKACIDLGRDRYHQGHGVPNLMQMLLSV